MFRGFKEFWERNKVFNFFFLCVILILLAALIINKCTKEAGAEIRTDTIVTSRGARVILQIGEIQPNVPYVWVLVEEESESYTQQLREPVVLFRAVALDFIELKEAVDGDEPMPPR